MAIKGFEGGQMPLHRRLPKRGFTNIFRLDYNEISVGAIQQAIDAGKLDASATVTVEMLVAVGLLRRPKDGVRLLGGGEITSAVTFEIAGASAPALAAVEKAGGKVIALAKKPEAKAA